MRPSSLRATRTVHAYAVTVVDDSTRGDDARASETSKPPSVVVLPADGDVVGGVYRLTRLLGAGMFGKVYVAQREDVPEHQVALKILPRSHYIGRNVERELVMLATVGHPNVVQLKDHGMTAEYVWFTMPVYRGETLAERLERGPLELREAYDIFLPIARGLEALHDAGLRHQDIKPENIYLANFGGRVHPILLDLGVAAEREATFIAGTALYASPEQLAAFRGDASSAGLVTEKMDTYCLASTLLVSLVGDEYFPGGGAKTTGDLERSLDVRADSPLREGALHRVHGVAREKLEAALKRWLALDPASRPSMSRMADELEVLLEPERELARAETRARLRQKTSLQRFRIGAGALVLLAAAGAWVAFSKRETFRLASELEVARAEGAKSFDQLDMCNAMYKSAQTDVTKCRTSRDDTEKLHKEQLEAQLKLCSSGAELDCALETKKLRDQHHARLQVCEDEAQSAARTAEEERVRLTKEWDRSRATLEADRDAQKKIAEGKTAELASCTEERARIGEERNAMRVQVDAMKAAPSPPSSAAVTMPAVVPSPASSAIPALPLPAPLSDRAVGEPSLK